MVFQIFIFWLFLIYVKICLRSNIKVNLLLTQFGFRGFFNWVLRNFFLTNSISTNWILNVFIIITFVLFRIQNISHLFHYFHFFCCFIENFHQILFVLQIHYYHRSSLIETPLVHFFHQNRFFKTHNLIHRLN